LVDLVMEGVAFTSDIDDGGDGVDEEEDFL